MTQLSLLPEKDPAPPKRPTEPIARAALIEGAYRLWLKRVWNLDLPIIAWIGLNPSKADHKKDDPTMLREIGFSFRWGYGGLVKLNIYPFISSAPAEMRRWRSRIPTTKAFHAAWMRNMEIAAAELRDVPLIVAAWGEGAEPSDLTEFTRTVSRLLGKPLQFHCLAKTASGAPRHTLARGTHHIPDDTLARPWGA